MSDSGLVQDLLTRAPSSVRSECSLTRLLVSLDEKERNAVESALEKIKVDTGAGRAKVYSYSWLSEVLKKNGYSISSSTIARHMTGKCSCE